MRRLSCLIIVLILVLTAGAQNKKPNGGLSREKFNAEMQQFIIKEACLTPKEAEMFIPIYNEMLQKQRSRFDKMRKIWRKKPKNEAACLEVIKERDKLDLELKRIQQSYHNKLLAVIPAQKLFDVIKAEERFHRGMLRKYGGNRPPKEKK